MSGSFRARKTKNSYSSDDLRPRSFAARARAVARQQIGCSSLKARPITGGNFLREPHSIGDDSQQLLAREALEQFIVEGNN